MALITCPECGAQISNKATFCPHCGLSYGYAGKCPKKACKKATSQTSKAPKRLRQHKKVVRAQI